MSVAVGCVCTLTCYLVLAGTHVGGRGLCMHICILPGISGLICAMPLRNPEGHDRADPRVFVCSPPALLVALLEAEQEVERRGECDGCVVEGAYERCRSTYARMHAVCVCPRAHIHGS